MCQSKIAIVPKTTRATFQVQYTMNTLVVALFVIAAPVTWARASQVQHGNLPSADDRKFGHFLSRPGGYYKPYPIKPSYGINYGQNYYNNPATTGEITGQYYAGNWGNGGNGGIVGVGGVPGFYRPGGLGNIIGGIDYNPGLSPVQNYYYNPNLNGGMWGQYNQGYGDAFVNPTGTSSGSNFYYTPSVPKTHQDLTAKKC